MGHEPGGASSSASGLGRSTRSRGRHPHGWIVIRPGEPRSPGANSREHRTRFRVLAHAARGLLGRVEALGGGVRGGEIMPVVHSGASTLDGREQVIASSSLRCSHQLIVIPIIEGEPNSRVLCGTIRRDKAKDNSSKNYHSAPVGPRSTQWPAHRREEAPANGGGLLGVGGSSTA